MLRWGYPGLLADAVDYRAAAIQDLPEEIQDHEVVCPLAGPADRNPAALEKWEAAGPDHM